MLHVEFVRGKFFWWWPDRFAQGLQKGGKRISGSFVLQSAMVAKPIFKALRQRN